MEFKTHNIGGAPVAEIISEQVVVANVDDAIDLIGNLGYNGFDKAIVHARNFTPAFFDLSTQLAGDVLQKFTNYRLRICIVGDFTNIESKSLRDFIFESNKGRQVNFVATFDEALTALTEK